MAKHFIPREELEKITRQEEKILALVRDENRRTKEKFPLPYALFATFGFIATISGFGKWIDTFPFLRENPEVLLGVGVIILIVSGTVYKKVS